MNNFNHLLSVSLLLSSALGCGAVPAPLDRHSKEKAKPTSASDLAPATGEVRGSVLLGWYCPSAAAGRPAVEPALAKISDYSDSQQFLDRAVRARLVKRFSVLAWNGSRAGNFSVAGAATVSGQIVAVGSYLGAGPCDTLDALGKISSQSPQCLSATSGCALALGVLEASGGFEARPYEEDSEAPAFVVGEACEVARSLQLDVDGDGVVERFSLEELLAGRMPEELALSKEAGGACSRSFASEVKPGQLSRIAVLDLDGDGRPEVVYLRNGNEMLIYGAPERPGRMALLGHKLLTSAPK